jgi:hypothetical protein
MIRPITLVCWLLALSAGLYLYRAKHEVELMDQHIELIAKQTSDLRIESRGLLDEWIRLGEPEQLHKYSDEYLGLQPIAPSQFARLSDLAARLPPTQPDPPQDQADVVAQSSGGATTGVPSPAVQASADLTAAVQVTPAEAATVEPDQETAAGGDDIPVPPIPPATLPVAAVTRSATPLPLQARPVTPRPADGQLEPETERTHIAASPQAADETHVARVTPTEPVEPHQGPSGPTNGPGTGQASSGQASSGQASSGQASGQAHGMAPLQAQAPREVTGLPPLQTQGPIREVAQGPGRVPAQIPAIVRPSGQAPGSVIGQAQVQSALRPAEPRGPAGQGGRQGQAQMEQPQAEPGRPAAYQAPMAQGGSLLGMSRSSVPLPLPAPTPVNANWSGPAGAGSIGSGR